MSRHPLWTAAQAARATGGQAIGDWQATGVSIDSRSLTPGDLFVALAGPNFDGHDFVAKALANGAAAALVARRPADLPATAPLLLVEDTLSALEALARAARQRSRARIAGITGSAGKTGTKEALKACLAAVAPTHASAGSLNNHWGVPLSLARLPESAAYGVFEMGMNHPGEIRALTRLVRPQVALITNIGLAHKEFFASEAEIADAKAEIFEGLEPDGVAVLPRDDRFFEHLKDAAERAGVRRIVSFGRHPEADLRLLASAVHATGSAVTALLDDEPLDYTLGLPGEHWVVNSLGVLAVVRALGADVATAAGQLGRLQPLAGRGQRRDVLLPDGSSVTLIDESYNANPLSMAAAVAVLGRANLSGEGRRIAVLGDMLELGGEAAQFHRDLAPVLERHGIDRVYLSGPQMRHLAEALPASMLGAHAEDSAALAPRLAGELHAGDVVLVKGSFGSRMVRVIEAIDALAAPLPRAANGG